MKKAVLSLMLILTLTLTACGIKPISESSESASAAGTETSASEEVSASEAPTEEPTKEPTAEPTKESTEESKSEASDSSKEPSSESSSASSGTARFSPKNYDEAAGHDIDLSELNVSTVDGGTFTAADFAKYDLTMVNVWATWCGGCVAELPDLAKVYDAYAAKGVGMLGVQIDEDTDGALQLIDADGIHYPVVQMDTLLATVTSDFVYVPTTFFVDANGQLVGGLYIGGRDYKGWSKIIDDILATRQ